MTLWPMASLAAAGGGRSAGAGERPRVRVGVAFVLPVEEVGGRVRVDPHVCPCDAAGGWLGASVPWLRRQWVFAGGPSPLV